MGKKCIICDVGAIYKIKNTSDFYCQECAEENFNDLDLLIKIEEDAKRLKAFLKEKMEGYLDEDVQDDKIRED
jgi:hypothetical protein